MPVSAKLFPSAGLTGLQQRDHRRHRTPPRENHTRRLSRAGRPHTTATRKPQVIEVRRLFDRRQLEDYTAELVEWTGGIDVAVVALADHGTDAQLTTARTVAERMVAQGSGIIVIMSATGEFEQQYRELAEHAAPHGVAVLPVFCTVDHGRNLSTTINHPILS